MEEAVHPDWSGLPLDLTAMVMRSLDIPDLFRAGSVCSSWYAAYSAVRRVRIPITDTSPCLLYSCADDDADTATLFSPSAGAAFKVRLPAPPFRSRHVVGAAHGWVVTADEASNLQAVNPLTGAQVDLPPATGLHHVEVAAAASDDHHGRPVYNLYDRAYPGTPGVYTAQELRLCLYNRVCLSCSPSAGRGCVVLLIHMPLGEMSYARLGDHRWTLITENETVPWNLGYRAAAHNGDDGLFYVLTHECSIYTFDLNGPAPKARKISQRFKFAGYPNSYIAFAPWGDVLHVSRDTLLRAPTDSVHVPEEHTQEVINPCLDSYTDEMELHKIDVAGQKLVRISGHDLHGHALFLGFNSAMLLDTKGFPRLKPDCAYLTDDNWEQIGMNMYGCRDIGIRSFETETLESLADLHSVSVPPWLNWPPPIWITPSLC